MYPPGLELAGLGLTPYGSASLRGKSPNAPLRSDVVSQDFWIFHGDATHVLTTLNGGCLPPLLAEYEGAGGQSVGFWDLPSDRTADYLAFQFGRQLTSSEPRRAMPGTTCDPLIGELLPCRADTRGSGTGTHGYRGGETEHGG